MNKDEIKKALKFCADINDCDNCPYDVVRSCSDRLKLDARELITEQEKEIERLKAENETYCKQINQAYDTGYDDGYDSCQDDIKQAKIEAVKEFAEELKAKTMCIKEYDDGTRILQTSNKLIDQSVKIFLDELLKEYE